MSHPDAALRATGVQHIYLIEKIDKGGPLDLEGAAIAVKEADHEVEEVGFAQVGQRLLCELHLSDIRAVLPNGGPCHLISLQLFGA